ncbi:MAG: hypothetical protein OYH77_08995 [Pseudomonadota bacterium]|nr:hypothetical protein [Pseudomonadota bacterium]
MNSRNVMGLLLCAVLAVPLFGANTGAVVSNKGFVGRLLSKAWQGLAVGGVSLALLCSQVGCHVEGDEDYVSNDVLDVHYKHAYDVHDYLGRYVLFTTDGKGSIDSGVAEEYYYDDGTQSYVFEVDKGMNLNGDLKVPIDTIIGVMNAGDHALGELVEFDIDSTFSYLDIFNATRVSGVISAVYVKPGDPSVVTAVSVSVRSALYLEGWVPVTYEEYAFVPYNKLKFID